ncbi:hypothetical protein GCM10023334_106940 [Nonomuraea thailandensis]
MALASYPPVSPLSMARRLTLASCPREMVGVEVKEFVLLLYRGHVPLEVLRPTAAALTAIVLVAELGATDLRSGPEPVRRTRCGTPAVTAMPADCRCGSRMGRRVVVAPAFGDRLRSSN